MKAKSKEFISCPINNAIIRCNSIYTIYKENKLEKDKFFNRIVIGLINNITIIWYYHDNTSRNKIFKTIKNQLINETK